MNKRFGCLIAAAVMLVVLAPATMHAQDTGERQNRQYVPPRRPDAGPGVSAESRGLVESLRASGQFTKLLALIEEAGMTETLSNSTKGLTLFAPDDDAFALLPAVLVADLNSDPVKARGWILPYILTGKLLTKDLIAPVPHSRLRTFAGTTLQFSNRGGSAGLLIIFNAAASGVGGSPIGMEASKAWPCCGRVTSADHFTANGIYHVITFAGTDGGVWR